MSTPGALELFAGSCKLSKCLKSHGFLAHGIDHKKCKNCVGPCVVLDLTRKKGQKFVEESLLHGKVACMPMAPPCGTSSRAREKKLSRRLLALGVPEPKPLRGDDHPLGFPWLEGRDLRRVQLANQCYEFVARIFRMCIEFDVPCFIENPKGSRMWDIPYIRTLFDLPGVHFSVFHSCMHGGQRDKATALLHNCVDLCQLELLCDGQHTHKAWGASKTLTGVKFDTSEEAEYPLLLCQRISRLFAQACLRRGWQVQVDPRAAPAVKVIPATWKIAGGRQPRGRAAPNLIREDLQVVSCDVNLNQFPFFKNKSGRFDFAFTIDGRQFPKGTRLIDVQPSVSLGEAHSHSGDGRVKVTLGIPYSPLAAVQVAKQCQHPFDAQKFGQHPLSMAIFYNLVWGPEEMHRHRVSVLSWMKRRKRELSPREVALKDAMNKDVADILAGKSLLLFGELLDSIGYGDTRLIEDLKQGLPITGNAEFTQMFAVDFKPAQLDIEDLWRVARFSQEEVDTKIPQHMKGGVVSIDGVDTRVADKVWESTMQEAQKGWIKGPLEREEVDAIVGKLWTPSRRFGIVQSGKVRNIDDMSEFSVNMTYGTPEKLDLGGVDEVVALAARWQKIVNWESREAVIHNEDGSSLRGAMHPHYLDGNNLRLVGRCLDLKGAYKQIALRPQDHPNAVLAVFDPNALKVKYFVSRVLPFGATGAVMGFNRVARARRDILQRLLYVPVVNYFDDYPHIDVVGMAVKSQVVMEEFLDVLGWQVSMEEKKRIPAQTQFTVLGVVVDLSKSVDGIVVVKNKPERVQELRETVAETKLSKSFPAAVAARVQGRLLYAEAQCSGRWLTPLLEPVKARALMPRTVQWLSPQIQESLDICIRIMEEAPDREIDLVCREQPCLVFTDGAFEGGVATCGAVVFSPRERQVVVMGFQVPHDILAEWQEDGSKQVIAQAEMLPIALVKKQMFKLLHRARVIFFIDNDGVKEAMVKGVTDSPGCKKILRESMLQDAKNHSMSWYTRVPSPSNIADGPSRLDFSEVKEAFDVKMLEPQLDYKEWGIIG